MLSFRRFQIYRGRHCAKVKPPIEVVLLSRGSAHAGEVFVSAEIKQVIYEDKYMTCAEFGKWKKRFPDIEFQGGSERIDKLREFKDADELKLIIAAQRIAEKAYTHILDFYKSAAHRSGGCT